MSILKRIKVMWAAASQEWHVFTCPQCGARSYLSGHAPDLNGLLCQSCESEQFEKWMGDFTARMKGAI
jgi:hypothetical protein